MGAHDRAIAEFTAALDLPGLSAQAYLQRAQSYVQKGLFDLALADANRAVRLGSRNDGPGRLVLATAFNLRGNVYDAKREYDKALAAYGEALALREEAVCYRNRAATYNRLGQFGRAIADASEAIRVGSRRPPADVNVLALSYLERGVAYQMQGNYDQAIADYGKAVSVRPTSLAYRSRAVSYYLKKQYQQAFADATEAIRISPRTSKQDRENLAEAYNVRGNVYHAEGSFDKAIAEYTSALGLSAGAVLYANRATSRFRKKEFQAAIEDYTKALQMDAHLALAYYGRAIAFVELKQWEKADGDLKKALDNKVPRAWSLLAHVAVERAKVTLQSGEHGRAVTEAEELLRRPDAPPLLTYGTAKVFALAAAAAHQDRKLPVAERDKACGQYATRATEYLRKAQAAGYFKEPATVQQLKQDPDFKALESQLEFRKLLADLEKKVERAAPPRKG
jgi:tetratricopeptide (TPR) repeat protein